jgi:hypothetical protein
MSSLPTTGPAPRPIALAAVGGRLAQQDATMSVGGPLGAAFLVSVALVVVLGLATAGLAVYRYRNRADPTLRAFVAGLVLIAVAPLPFRVFLAGTVPQTLRDVLPPAFQTLGLLAILWAMYGDPRSADGLPIRRPTAGDLAVVGLSTALALATVLLGNAVASRWPALIASAVVVAFATFVAGQAARAAYRYRSPAMASLSVGIVCLAALPVPTGAVLLAAGGVPDAVVVGLVSGALLVGEAAMFATLLYR